MTLRQGLLRAGICVAAIAVTGCDRDDPSVKWVDLWSIPWGTCSTEIVQTSLYDYLPDRSDERDQFKISKNPPLRFAFPAVYYQQGANLKGGPQAYISLSIEPETMGPARNSPGTVCATGKVSKTTKPFGMSVDIYSNIFRGWGGVDPAWKSIDYENPYYFMGKKVKPVGNLNLFDMFTYDTDSMGSKFLSAVDPFPSVSDLSSGSFIGYPKDYAHSVVKRIECDRRNPTCVISLFYKGRGVSAILPKKLAAQSEAIGHKIVRFLDQANLDRK